MMQFVRRSISRPHRLLIGLLAVSLGMRLVLIFQPIEILLHKFLADDAFYYYALARNISHGHGVVFNQGVPTNGFHPLYAALLVPIFEVGYSFGVNVPVYASLIVLSVVTVSTAVPLYGIGDELHSTTAGVLTAFLWLFNPYILFVSLSGLESPLQMLFIATLIWYLVARVNRPIPTHRQAVVVGALVALAFMSRMSSVLAGIGVFGALALRILEDTDDFGNPMNLLTRLRPVFKSGVVASVLVAPWLLWSVLTVGRLTPVSGAALRVIRLEGSTPYSILVWEAMRDTGRFVWNYFFYDLFAFGPLVALLILGGILLVLVRGEQVRTLVVRLDFLIVGSLLYYPFYWFYELGMRPWYSLFTLSILSILLGIALAELVNVSPPKSVSIPRAAVVVLLFSGLFVASGVAHYPGGTYPQEVTKWEGANYIENEIPREATVGSFNTGIYQYYTPNHDVINLDGVMNPATYRANERGEISDYICERNVAYILDPQGYVRDVESELTLTEVSRFPKGTDRGGGTYILYRVQGCN